MSTEKVLAQEVISLNDQLLCLIIQNKGIQIWRLDASNEEGLKYECIKSISKVKPSLLSYCRKQKRLLFKVSKLKLESHYVHCVDDQVIQVYYQRSIQINVQQNASNLSEIQKISQIESKGRSIIIVELDSSIALLNNQFKIIRTFSQDILKLPQSSIPLFNADRFQSTQYIRYYNSQKQVSNSVVITGYSRYFIVLDIFSGALVQKVNAHLTNLARIKFIRLKGKWDILATSSNRDQVIKLWDLTSLQCLSVLKVNNLTHWIEYDKRLKYLFGNSLYLGKKTILSKMELWKINQISRKQLIIQPLDRLFKTANVNTLSIKENSQQFEPIKNTLINQYEGDSNSENLLTQYFGDRISQVLIHGENQMIIIFLNGDFLAQKISIDSQQN